MNRYTPRSELLSTIPLNQSTQEITQLLWNVSYTSFTLQEDFITANTFGDILYENFLFDIPKIMDICTLYGGENSANTPLLRKMLDNIFSKQPK